HFALFYPSATPRQTTQPLSPYTTLFRSQPSSAHARQVVAYSEMYDCEYYVVLYINYAKKGWNMSEEDYEKTPDIRAFCTLVTDEDRKSTRLNSSHVSISYAVFC